MIKSIYMENFFSFKNTTIELNSGENLLVGINGSGKSNLMKAIRFLKEGVAGIGLQKLILNVWGGFDAVCYCGSKQNQIVLKYTFDKDIISKYGWDFRDDVMYEIKIIKIQGQSNYYLIETIIDTKGFKYLELFNGKGKIFGYPKDKQLKPGLLSIDYSLETQELGLTQVIDPITYRIQYYITEAIKNIVIYSYLDTSGASELRKPVISTSDKRLYSDGSNLPQILNTININQLKNYLTIIEKLKDVNDKYMNIGFNILGQNIELMLQEKGLEKSIHVTHISDGTLRYLCLMSIFLNDNRGRLICIDEPEIGLHPDMIYNIAKLIKESASDSQYIIATHSPNLLNQFDIKSIRVFEKNDENNSVVTQYNNEDFKEWYDEFMPGNMWLNGDIGGTRW